MDKLITRKVNLEDREAIWQWWNDSTTRKMMKLNHLVPWEEHIKWFDNILKYNDKILLISIVNDEKIGVVRFDLKEKDIYEVSINLNPLHRSKGYGKEILKSSITHLKQFNPNVKKLFAMFKKENIASKKTFLSNGFNIVNEVNTNCTYLNRFDNNSEEYSELIFKIESGD